MTTTSDSRQPTAIDKKSSRRIEMSVGAAISVSSVCLIGTLMSAFLFLLNFTDILVNNTAALAASKKEATDSGILFALVVCLLPGLAAYWLSKMIINKA